MKKTTLFITFMGGLFIATSKSQTVADTNIRYTYMGMVKTNDTSIYSVSYQIVITSNGKPIQQTNGRLPTPYKVANKQSITPSQLLAGMKAAIIKFLKIL